MALLIETGDVAGFLWELVADLAAKPAAVHAGLWDTENRLCAHERAGEFGPVFITTARASSSGGRCISDAGLGVRGVALIGNPLH